MKKRCPVQKKFRFSFWLLISLAALFSIFAVSCRFDAGDSDNSEKNMILAYLLMQEQKKQAAAAQTATAPAQYATITGSISLPEGAVPARLMEAVECCRANVSSDSSVASDYADDSESSSSGLFEGINTKISKSALASQPGNLSTSDEYTYYVKVFNSSGVEVSNDAAFTPGKESFILTLSFGTWTIEAGIKRDEVTLYKSVSSPVTLSEANSVFRINFVLKPQQSSERTGTMELSMTVPSNITKATVALVSGDEERWIASGFSEGKGEHALSISSGTVSLSSLGIPSGSYTVRLNFYDGADVLLYGTQQLINIYDGLETNKWFEPAASSSTNSTINSSGTFAVTQDIIRMFSLTNFYVNSSVSTDGTGSFYAPAKSLEKVLNTINSTKIADTDYTINITGTQTAASAMTSGRAYVVPAGLKSLTIEGTTALASGVPQDVINGNNKGTVIEAKSPLTLRNIMITGGKGSDYGGGIYAKSSGVSVKLESGAFISSNKAKKLGGGLYLEDSAELEINDGAKITGNIITDENGSGLNGGMAIYAKNANVTMNGGEISGHHGNAEQTASTSVNQRGTVRIEGSSVFNLNDGKITGNSAKHLAGSVMLTDTAVLNMSGGEISGGQAGYLGTPHDGGGAGLYLWGSSSVNMSGGKICGNKCYAADTKNGNGAALVLTDSAVFTMTGGTIEENEVMTGTKRGGAVLLDASATFKISGDARIPYGGAIGKNDFYLERSGTTQAAITVAGSFSGSDGTVATITPEGWARGSSVLTAESSIITNEVASRFKISDGDFNINKNTSNTRGFLAAPIYVAGQGTKGTDYFVCSRGGSTASSAAGTKANPYATLTQALDAIDGGGNEVIYIDGKIVGKSEIPDGFTTAKCSRLTLKGASYLNPNADGSPKDALDGNYADRTLVISSAVPVVIENLKITRGWSKDLAASGTKGGGGIRLNENACLELSDGAMVTENYARLWGGGIFVQTGASLYMNGSSYVGDYIETTASHTYVGYSDAPSEPDSCCSNKAGWYGGGIYSHGSVYLGYKNEGGSVVESDWTGGVCRNSSDYGGGLYLAEGSLKISSGNIAYNYCTENGGAIGADEDNETNVELLGCEIKENAADLNGGAIYVANEVSVQGNVSIPFGVTVTGGEKETGAGKNDIYLKEGKTITVSGTLTPPSGVTTVATITPSEWKRGKQVLSAESASLIADNVSRFATIDADFTVSQSTKTGEGTKGIIYAPILVKSTTLSAASQRGTNSAPYSSIKNALAAISADATEITVSGTVYGNQTVNSTDWPSSASSVTAITIAGTGTSPTLNASASGTVLTVNASGKEITLKDLTITNGSAANGGGLNVTAGLVTLNKVTVKANKADNGGGIYVDTNGKLSLEGQSSVKSNTFKTSGCNGAGIYNKGSVSVSDCIIESNTAGSSSTTGGGVFNASGANFYIGNKGSVRENSAYAGGGFYNEGTLYLGNTYQFTGTNSGLKTYSFFSSTGNIYKNTATNGGGIYNSGTVNMRNGVIGTTQGASYKNSATNGGGLYMNGGTFNMGESGTTVDTYIRGNSASSGGGVYINAGTFTMKNNYAQLLANSATSGGGGVYIFDGTLDMQGGKIGTGSAANTSSSDGAGVTVRAYATAIFKMGGGATVAKENEVYLGSTSLSAITVSSAISGTAPVATIKLASGRYDTTTEDYKVILKGSAVSSSYKKFALAKTGYYIDSAGKVQEGYFVNSVDDAVTVINGITSGTKTVVIDGTVTSLTNLHTAIKNCSGKVNLNLSGAQGLTEIPANAFKDNTKLAEIVLPTTVTKIGEAAFEGCTELRGDIDLTHVNEIGINAFHSISGALILSTSGASFKLYDSSGNLISTKNNQMLLDQTMYGQNRNYKWVRQ